MPELLPEHVLLTRYLDAAEVAALYGRLRRGDVVKLHSGAYVEAAVWGDLDPSARHRGAALAVALHFDRALVFSHLTAAALWRLPQMGPWPNRPEVAAPHSAGGRSTAAFARRTFGSNAALEVGGLRVTPLEATVVDVAATVGFAHGVVVADAALRRTIHAQRGVPKTTIGRTELLFELERIPLLHGQAKARRVVEFADGRADRPGESMSRASMHLAHVSPPELQVPMLGASGKEYTVDFWWRKYNTIGEFDGKYKYTDPEYMNGRTAQQVLYDEKVREDDLRAASHGFSRWSWSTACSPMLLREHLGRAGIR